MSGAAARLRGLRWLLTGLFTALNAAGLLLFAWLALDMNAQQGERALDADLSRVTPAVIQLLEYSDGTLTTARLTLDSVYVRCPQFAVLPTGTSAFEPRMSRLGCANVDQAVLGAVADDAVRTRTPQSGYLRGTDGRLVRFYAEPIASPNGPYIGAVVRF
jgi:two-component system OmpR family sensor kinase